MPPDPPRPLQCFVPFACRVGPKKLPLFENPGSATKSGNFRVSVASRECSERRPVYGLFKGAVVVRGEDWKNEYGNQDGKIPFLHVCLTINCSSIQGWLWARGLSTPPSSSDPRPNPLPKIAVPSFLKIYANFAIFGIFFSKKFPILGRFAQKTPPKPYKSRAPPWSPHRAGGFSVPNTA